jgi:hypothetical protein
VRPPFVERATKTLKAGGSAPPSESVDNHAASQVPFVSATRWGEAFPPVSMAALGLRGSCSWESRTS